MKKRDVKEKIGEFFNAYKINATYLKEVIRDDPMYVIVSSITTILNTLFPIINIILPKLVIDAITLKEGIINVVILISILWCANLLFVFFNSFVSSQYLSIFGSMSSMRFLTKISRKASELDLSQIERKENIDKMEMAKNVIYRGIHQNIIESVAGLISAIIMMVTTIGIILSASLWLTIIVVLTCLVCTYINFRIEHDNVELQHENQQAMTKMNYYTSLLEGKNFIKEIRLYNLGGWIEQRCTDTMKQIKRNIFAKNKKWGVFRVLEGFISTSINYGAYMLFAILALINKITIGDFSMYFQSVTSFRANFNSCLSFLSQMMINAEYINAYYEFMGIKSKMHICSTNKIKSEFTSLNEPYAITFQDVSFKYESSGNLILNHINLQLLPQKVYAIVGENGAGKTTLINLLCRLYDPIDGEILVNGINIRDLPILKYRAFFSALFQGFNNISFSLAENISLDKQFDEAVADTLMKSLDMQEFIKQLPMKYDSYLGKSLDDNGIVLSGGQNQRLAIARAIYRNAPFLILDEPTSALDPLAEDALIRLIRDQAKGKTILYVSHRLASVQIADTVIYIHNNTIEDFGTHDEIYSRNSSYKEIYDAQAKYYR